MNARNATALVLKLTGLYLVIRFVIYLPFVLGAVRLDGIDWSPLIYTALQLLNPVAGLLLIKWSDTIARRLVPDEDGMLFTGIDGETARTLAFCIIGLLLIAEALPRLALFVTDYVVVKRMLGPSGSPNSYGQIASIIVQIAMGIYLFLQPAGLSGLWKQLRGLSAD